MDNDLFDAIERYRMPEFNRDVVDGLAVREMERVEAYMHRVWQCAAEDFPQGLTYDGFRRLSPEEEYMIRVRRGSNTATLEIARSNIYMVAYKLKWQGQDLPECNVQLPIVEDAGIIYIRGTKYAICPVLGDIALSDGVDSIFIPLLRDKMTFKRYQHHIVVDGHLQGKFFVWASIHHEAKNDPKPGGSRIVTTLAHYLFAKYGVTGTLLRYANAHAVIGTHDTISRAQYPLEDWVLIASTRNKPGKLRDKSYRPTDLVIAIPRPEWTETVANILSAFFYVADYFPHRVTAEDADETYLWCAIMGLAIWGTGTNEGQLVQEVESHLHSLDGYVDNEARRDMAREGVIVEDIYDLFVYLIDNFTRRIVEAYPNLPSMYGKQLMILRYVMKDLVKSINLFMYRVKVSQKKALTYKDIAERLKAEIEMDKILDINKRHGEVDTSISSPGDNKYFKITSRIVKQVNSSGRRERTISLIDPANFLHHSIPEGGSYLTPSGSDPTGHERVNPCIQLGPGYVVERRESTRELLDDVERRIRRI